MIGDSYNKVSGVTTPAGQLLTATTTTVSEDSIDLLANKDIALGREVNAIVNIATGLVSARVGATAAVAVATDILTLASHGLLTGAPVVLVTTTTPSGVNFGRIYYAVVLSSSTFRLASTLALALAGAPDVDFGGTDGNVTFTVVPELEVQIIAAGNAALTTEIQVLGSSGKLQGRIAQGCVIGTNTIAAPSVDPLPEGTPVTLAGTFTGSGLAAGTYFACNTTTSGFALAATRADAMAATPVTLAFVVGSSSGVTYTIADSMLAAAGPQVLVRANPLPVGIPGRFLGLRYVASAPLAQGAVIAHISPLAAASDPKVYPSGFGV